MTSPDVTLPDPVGCGATRGGCGCMGLWDCWYDNKLQRAIDALREAAPEMPEDWLRATALSVLREAFRVQLERDYRLDGWEDRITAIQAKARDSARR